MFDRDEVVSLARDVRLDVQSDRVHVEARLGRCTVPLEGLFEILRRFERPTALGAVVADVAVRGATDWAERTATILALRRVCAIAPEAHANERLQGFANPSIHARMLADSERVTTYLRAIKAAVRPDDVVLDLGTGTGVLAVAAAQAGARHVFAIEETSIADVAEEVFRVNGVSDRVTLLRGHSTRLDLPERATLLVTETLDNDPLGEEILVFVDDAKRRLLHPGARFVPSRIRIFAQLVEVPEGRVPLLDARRIEEWRAIYGINLSPLRARHPGAKTRYADDADRLAGLARCSIPVVVDEIDIARAAATTTRKARLIATKSTTRVGVALGFDVVLEKGAVLEVGPHGPATSHWRWRIFTDLEPRKCEAGAVVAIEFARDRTGCRLDILD